MELTRLFQGFGNKALKEEIDWRELFTDCASGEFYGWFSPAHFFGR